METIPLGRPSCILPISVWRTLRGVLFLLACLPVVRAQTPSGTSQSPEANATQDSAKPDAKTPSDEIVTRDSPATFKLRVNLVLVRVVVRDANGKVITNLKKEDFQLTDNRNLQSISSFSVETPASHLPAVKMETSEATTEGKAVKATELPQRFVALFFDDLHLSMADAMLSRQAATKLLGSMQAGDRFAIFTTSGQVGQDFTADRPKLNDAIQRILPSYSSTLDCPPMSLYEAYQIIEMNDPLALQVAIQDVIQCTQSPKGAQLLAQSAAQRELSIGEYQVRRAFGNLDAMIRKMSALPGQRAIIVMSPGFFVTPSVHESGEIIDRATKANIVINAIDARGLYVSSVYDASNRFSPTPEKVQFVTTEESIQNEVLGELADGTGGLFFHNRNDIDQGLLQAAAVPEISYVLGFMPQNLKLDGKYHHLRVTLVNKQKWALQARHGYFAPHGESDPEATAREEIQQAVFSQEELRELPIQCQTQFFSSADGVHLTVVARIGTGTLRFRKAEDRNKDKLTVVTAVFDENGNLLAGLEKIIGMQFKDATLERVNKTGLIVKFSFDLQPGTFLVRIVVRDSEGAQMAAVNRGVVIPKGI
jgi:VWFA-related protein